MAKIAEKCKLCRREGKKLFLRGERCDGSKCALTRRNTPPGMHGAKGRAKLTPYGLQLREKQIAKRVYGMSEQQFRNYYEKANELKGEVGVNFLSLLEKRLDNVVFRLGLAPSHTAARQLVSHAHVLVNNKKVTIPSYIVKVNDVISVKEKSRGKKLFTEKVKDPAKMELPRWLALDLKTMSAKILSEPNTAEMTPLFDIKSIVEFYSR